jgi:hypothetical protein
MTHKINHLEQGDLPLQQGQHGNSAITALAQTVISNPVKPLTDAEKLEQFSIELGHGSLDGSPSNPISDEEFDALLAERRSQACKAHPLLTEMSDDEEFDNEPLSFLRGNDSFESYGLSNSAPSTPTTPQEESAVFVSAAELGKQLLAEGSAPVKQSRLVGLLCVIPRISKAVQALRDLIGNSAALISMGRSLDERLTRHLEFPGSTTKIKADHINNDCEGMEATELNMQAAEKEFNETLSQMGSFEKALLTLAMKCMGVDSTEGKVTGAKYVREYLKTLKEKFDAKQTQFVARENLFNSEFNTREALEAGIETALSDVHAQMVQGRNAIASKELTQWLALYEACVDTVSKKTLSFEEVTVLREDLLDLERKARNVIQTLGSIERREEARLVKQVLTNQEDLSPPMQENLRNFNQRFPESRGEANATLLVSQLLSALKVQVQLLAPKAPSTPLPPKERALGRVGGHVVVEGGVVVGFEPTKRAGFLKSLATMFTGNQ